jgi:hypothetical protein
MRSDWMSVWSERSAVNGRADDDLLLLGVLLAEVVGSRWSSWMPSR